MSRDSSLQSALRNASEFFMGKADVQRAANKLAEILDEDRIPYAIVGAIALNKYGYERVTSDVDVLLTRGGLDEFKRRWLGRGYVEKFAGSTGVRDTEQNVTIDVLIAGQYPGDGKPKPVAFPDPATGTNMVEGLRLLPLERLLELKLASGISAAHRLRDLADVLEVIRIRNLPPDFEHLLNPSVREKFRELWQAAQHHDPESMR
jgi:hypothetical protein